MDLRQICEQDNLSKVQLEQKIDRSVNQFNSADVAPVNQIGIK